MKERLTARGSTIPKTLITAKTVCGAILIGGSQPSGMLNGFTNLLEFPLHLVQVDKGASHFRGQSRVLHKEPFSR